MTKLLLSAAAGLAALAGASVATPVLAQATPAAKVAVVDLDRITRECNACRTASAALQQQVQAYETRANQLQTQLRPEAQSLETAVQGLAGKQPDAALAGRIRAFQQRQQSAAQELQTQQVQLQRNQGYVREQLLGKLQPLYAPAMTRRGANLLVEAGQALAYDPSLDLTNDLLASLNAALPSLAVVAPAQPAQTAPARPAPAAQPSGR